MAELKLTAKQAAFCEEYLIDLNATQAAIRAGYSEKTAQVIGAENLSKPIIQQRIQQLMKERSERTQTDYDWVLTEAKKSYEINAYVIHDEEGNKKQTNPAAAAKFLELAGKHTKVKAFADEKEAKETPQDITINFIDAVKPDAD